MKPRHRTQLALWCACAAWIALGCQAGGDDADEAGAGSGGPVAGEDGSSGTGSGQDGSAGASGQNGNAGTDGNAGSSGDGGSSGQAGQAGSEPVPLVPGTPQELSLSPADQAELDALEEKLSELEGLSSSELLERHPMSYAELGYDPSEALNLDVIQASNLALDDAELAKLGEQGFVIAPRRSFSNMAYGYTTLYSEDLPVYVSLDSILDAVHLSYDAILKQLEQTVLTDELRAMLTGARQTLAGGAIEDAETAADVDLFLAVALSLLETQDAAPVAGGDGALIDELVAKGKAADGIQEIELFGASRLYDFSQLKPRGHYTDSELLERYFRAMMWLGRTDFRLIEQNGDGTQTFHRRQLENVLALRDVVSGQARDAHSRIDAAITSFVGEHDYMQLAEVDALLEDLGASTAEEALEHDDATLAQAIIDGGYGAQRIASQVIFKSPSAGPGTLPLSRSFALMGQRYVIDSHVFSNVVFDRVPRNQAGIRHLPDPLDAAYAALGNASALPLLESGLTTYEYAEHLERMRVLTDEHDEAFWSQNLYNLWLSALRAISPAEGAQDAAASDMPAVTATEPWARRVMNTQLGSWAELRHDTILYVKQSYTTGVVCEFPDAYVDPYPAAFERIALFAAHGREVATVLESALSAPHLTAVQAYFDELESVALILKEMAEYQASGMPFNDAQMAFINDAVSGSIEGCGGPTIYQGWYSRLLYDKSDAEMDPTIADVHTHPGDDPPPTVLHVGTGMPRLMVVTVDTCEGPRAYAGLAFAYHEHATDGVVRLTDPEWLQMVVSQEGVADVPWMSAILP